MSFRAKNIQPPSTYEHACNLHSLDELKELEMQMKHTQEAMHSIEPVEYPERHTNRKPILRQKLKGPLGKTLSLKFSPTFCIVVMLALFGSLISGTTILLHLPDCDVQGWLHLLGILNIVEVSLPLVIIPLAMLCLCTPTFVSPVLLISGGIGYVIVKLGGLICAMIVTFSTSDCVGTLGYTMTIIYGVINLLTVLVFFLHRDKLTGEPVE